MEQNSLRILGVEDKEDVISNLLCHCINQSPGFASALLSSLVGCDGSAYEEVCAYARKRLGDSGVPDIMIKAFVGGDVADVIVVENKLMAREGADQTERYASAKTRTHLHNVLNPLPPPGDIREWHFVFLTLFPDQKPQCDVFSHATYQALLPALRGFSCESVPVLERLLGDFVEILTCFYEDTHLHSSDLVATRLSTSRGLDANYLSFRQLLSSLRYPADLRPESFAKENWKGRKPFICIISKPGWRGKTQSGLPYIIHVEPQFDCLRKAFKVYLHFEFEPYTKRKEAERKYAEQQIREFLSEQDAFRDHMRTSAFHDLTVGRGWNLVGSVDVDMTDMTVEDFRILLSAWIWEVAKIIDRYVATREQR